MEKIIKRKVIKQGNNTLTITLPRKWTDKYGIKAGDDLELIEKNKELIIGGHKDTRERKISIDVSKMDKTTMVTFIQGIYRYGYDTIEVTSDSEIIPHYRLQKNVSVHSLVYDAVSRLVGAEVISATKKRFVIKRITSESSEDFPTALRRIFLLLNEMTESFIQGAKENNTKTLESIEFQHINLKKFINFCLRLLNKFGYEDSRKTCFYFNIISLLSKTEDIIKNNSRYMLKHEIKLKSSQSFELLKDLQASIRLYYELFYSYKLDKIAELNKNRDLFREKLFKCRNAMSKEENLVIGGLSQIIEIILDMTETRMAMED